MFTNLIDASWVLGQQGVGLIFPLILALWVAIGDLRTRRIPNYLTLGIALSGLGFQVGVHGWSGLTDGCLGLLLGLALLLVPYLLGGMGAGDVKALAALGAWLGPFGTMDLFIYMAASGGIIALVALWWRGMLWFKLRQWAVSVVNWILCRVWGGVTSSAPNDSKTEGIPYGVAIALGMATLFIKGI